MQRVASRLGHDGDDGAGSMANGRVELRGFHLKLLDGQGDGKEGGGCAAPHVGRAVERPLIAANVADGVRRRCAAQSVCTVV